MTNFTNNNEVAEILYDLVGRVLDHSTSRMPGEAQMYQMYVERATQAIEDFYRNKILEARNDTLDALENHKKTLDYIVKDGAPRNPTNYEVYMRKAIEVNGKIADITTQFNRGDNDERA